MIDFEKLYLELETEMKGNQKRLPVHSSVKVFYGISAAGFYRLAFLSSAKPPQIPSTKSLKVSSGQESKDVFWTCFDLVNATAKPVFFALCEDLLAVVEKNQVEKESLTALKNRFFAWQNMFKQDSSLLPEEKIVGLLGELYFLKNFMIPKLGTDVAIDSWSGPDGASKDFSTTATWFEIKSVSLSTNNVKISSISQLSSPIPGFLVLIRYEPMSEQYDAPESNLYPLFKSIMALIDNDATKGKFISKLIAYGFDITGESYRKKYRIATTTYYEVKPGFPRLTEADLKFPEIDKVSYTLLINSLERFKAEEDTL